MGKKKGNSRKCQSKSQRIKRKARKSLKGKKVSNKKKVYVLDTSAIINQFIPKIINQGMKGKLIIPNAVMAEMEKLANQGREEGFRGLEEVTNLRRNKKVKLEFKGDRPTEMQINYAKSGEIDAMIRKIADKNDATLVTADLVQAKSAQAYGVNVLYLKPKTSRKGQKKAKKGFLKKFFKK